MRREVLSGLLFLVLFFPLPAIAEEVLSDVVEDVVPAASLVSDVAEGEVDPSVSDVAAEEAAPSVSDVAADVPTAAEPIVTVVQPETEAEVEETVGLLRKAFDAGTWPVVVGLVIMLLVWAVRRFALKTISEKWKTATPWVAAGLGLLSCVGLSLAIDTMPWWRALLDGLISGLLASGLWELVGKHILGKGDTPASDASGK